MQLTKEEARLKKEEEFKRDRPRMGLCPICHKKGVVVRTPQGVWKCQDHSGRYV